MNTNNPPPHQSLPRKRPLGRVLLRFALFPLGLAAYLFILFEEWLWFRLKSAMASLAKLPLVGRLEHALQNAPPAAAACAFIVPGAVLFPFKIAGIYLIAHGHPAFGTLVFILAKAVGAALIARVWHLTENSLRRIGWLSRLVDWIVDKKDRAKAWAAGLWAIRISKFWVARFRPGVRNAHARFAAKYWRKSKLQARKDFDAS